MARPSHVKVDLQALRSNYRWACDLAPESKTMAIVKADAYGHGAVACARALDDLAPAFGVACMEEAMQLRDAGIKKPILLLEGAFTDDEVVTASEQEFWLMVEDPWQVDAIVNAKLSQPVQVWVKMDTGMHRLGLAPFRLPELMGKLQASPNVADGMIMASHFACADELNNDFTRQQIQFFRDNLPTSDMPFSLANSAGILAWPQAHGTWNRAGFMLYGNTPLDGDHPSNKGLTPVMSLNSAVISLRQVAVGESVGYGQSWTAERPSTIATVAMGYADGYPRHASTGTPLLVNNQPAALIGRVSMDMITIDVTDLTGVDVGSPVCFWGPELTANEVAETMGTIGYELMTRVGLRLPKVYV